MKSISLKIRVYIRDPEFTSAVPNLVTKLNQRGTQKSTLKCSNSQRRSCYYCGHTNIIFIVKTNVADKSESECIHSLLCEIREICNIFGITHALCNELTRFTIQSKIRDHKAQSERTLTKRTTSTLPQTFLKAEELVGELLGVEKPVSEDVN